MKIADCHHRHRSAAAERRPRGRRQRTALLAALLSSAPAASTAFRASPSSPPSSRSRRPPSDVLASSHRPRLPPSRRMSSSASSLTALRFLWRNDEAEEDPPPSASVDESEEGDEPTFLSKLLPTAKVAVPSFLAGTVVTFAALFVPLLADYRDAFDGPMAPYRSDAAVELADGGGSGGGGSGGGASSGGGIQDPGANNVNQPVILFETILNDLNDAYVDDVDVRRLFETGVKAMTASLDPYTEFETRGEARELEESVTGRYGGVGLVIRGGRDLDDEVDEGATSKDNAEKIQFPSGDGGEKAEPSSLDASPPVATKDGAGARKWSDQVNKERKTDRPGALDDSDDEDEEALELKRARRKSREEGIRVVSAFEGYAYDAGMRVGDKLLAVDDFGITPSTAVDEVRDHLRGEPGTPVKITFLREGVGGGNKVEPQTIELERSVVHIPDVKYFGFIGDPTDGIGYIDLSGFANDAGKEVRFAIRALQHGAAMAAADGGAADGVSGMSVKDPTKPKVSDSSANCVFGRLARNLTLNFRRNLDESRHQGLVLDLRSNPGGLLTSAVDVATLFVPNGSDIVSAKGRGFPESLYRSKTEPALDPSTRLAVLVNEQTASAAEIVTGAVQDLDVGVVVGKGRTFGKGLVQNVQDLPYQTALKYTVAKYYTPSGRCIQSTVYEEGSSADGAKGGAKYKSKKVADKDRTVFLTAHGQEVKDGGGVEVDYKVEPQRASSLEIILLNSGSNADYAAEWSKNHELTDNFKVDDATYKDFQLFVEKRQKDGDMKLEVLYDSQLKELRKKLKASNFDYSRKELDRLRSDIIKDVKRDFTTYKSEIVEDLEQNILARYLPDSMLIERGSDIQVAETAKMLKEGKKFDKILAHDGRPEEKMGALKSTFSYDQASTKPAPSLQTRWVDR
ncbi:hypothetical protein ACHAWF_017101 [Thalassiosira exigua]